MDIQSKIAEIKGKISDLELENNFDFSDFIIESEYLELKHKLKLLENESQTLKKNA